MGGPVFRFITDLNETYFSFDTGESDRVGNKFYDNFLGKDLYVKYTKHNPLKGDKVNWQVVVDRIDWFDSILIVIYAHWQKSKYKYKLVILCDIYIVRKMNMQPVAYIYNEQITKYIFSEDHPMKPKRIKMAHSLI